MSWANTRRHLSELAELISKLEYQNLTPAQQQAKAGLVETFEALRTRVIEDYWREIEMTGSYTIEEKGLIGITENLKDELEADGNYLDKTQEAFDSFVRELEKFR
ncbi:hypothetical protein [Roseofilum casamattae]|uniref:Uncharacterized protein n=1 Tax=Roseofilum casamattae BLCC-M143 TaxID=3022442 RepID=A0ABT7BTR2_9CYAN|nr:hypothetical protein [Roseofilum casamattae]MDJ1181688.1 hypothetical protein [Roseofilum casamattae BLCC-M143]